MILGYSVFAPVSVLAALQLAGDGNVDPILHERNPKSFRENES